jgi:hypothetical protein
MYRKKTTNAISCTSSFNQRVQKFKRGTNRYTYGRRARRSHASTLSLRKENKMMMMILTRRRPNLLQARIYTGGGQSRTLFWR